MDADNGVVYGEVGKEKELPGEDGENRQLLRLIIYLNVYSQV